MPLTYRLSDGHVISSRHAGCGSSGWTDIPCPLQSVCQRHVFSLAPRRVGPLRGRHDHQSHVPQANAARQLPGVINQHLQRWLCEWRIAINVSRSTAIIFARAGRRFIQPRPVTFFGEPIQWVDTTRYLDVTLDTRLTWSPHIDQVRKRATERMSMLGPLLNRKSDLSVRNGVLLYKQLIRPTMNYACPTWRSAARTHVHPGVTIQVSSPLYWVPWCVRNRKIQEDRCVPLFAGHVRALTANLDSKLADVGSPLVRQLGRYLR